MEISRINWLAGLGFLIFGVIVFVRRWMGLQGVKPESHLGWALGGGLGAAAMLKAAYPIFLFVKSRSINLAAIDDLWLYVYCGSLAALFLGWALIERSFKVNESG